MNYVTKIKCHLSSILVILAVFLTASCASQQPAQERTRSGSMDNPQYHVQRGDEALLSKGYEAARSAYQKALDLDPDFSQALSGLAAASAYEVSKPESPLKNKQGVLKDAENKIKKALKTAKNDKDKARAHSFAIQVYLALQLPEGKWYEEVTDHFEDAIDLTPDDPEPFFYMGIAESRQLNYPQANKMFHRVLSLDGKYRQEANLELERIQKVQLAAPGSKFGAEIANVEKITRADVAALFIAELRLDRLYKQSQQPADSSYQTPKSQQKMNLDPLQKYPEAVDIAGHPLEDSIKEVIKLGVKGLSPDPAHKFHPGKEISRAEFAQLNQDLLIKITKDSTLATKYVDVSSPFPDVNANVWYYNAVRIVVERGLMQVKNKVTNSFQPMESVSGAEALITIRTIKEILNSYLK
ncbi:S-layer homology domain-containing protein [bacterium]|nr:S-layer homology domain-containing protein [bacterium]